MRSIGYSVETAIADIIDNSISASATQIELEFDSERPEALTILDDGIGMDADAVIKAMTLAGDSPLAGRASTDLGRFGLGLKTASFSQCRHLTVVSKTKFGQLVGFAWDLDHLAETGRWSLIQLDEAEIQGVPGVASLDANQHGTMVIWRKLDVLAGKKGTTARLLNEDLVRVRRHIALVFHRIIEKRGIRITVNGRSIDRVDPFLANRPGTQKGPEEYISTGNSRVRVQAYTLPFLNKMTREDRQLASIGASFKDDQGFYIYRNDRLVIWATWFRMIKKDEHTRLTRVVVDIPNSLDHLWSLDIKKAVAAPPPEVKSQLKRIVDRMAKPSRDAHSYRGRSIDRNDGVERVWTMISERSEFRYQVNRRHPTLADALARDPSGTESLLRLIESTFPIYEAAGRVRDEMTPSTRVEYLELVNTARAIWDNMGGVTGAQRIAAITSILKLTEPFAGRDDISKIVEDVAR
ncbi:ATP-binding protein [Tsukamurella sp. PLM1]|uniref:ATP-binding protein n=1 Tax=Tsukamurella sp. PLM1 TaxID=2929795 RepID=UPI002054A743|nr:ATP-binding protein [Tsukamurella sp. PLM1]BDH56807.1 ATPase [Tsukamurella sp. PLM1]